MQLRKIIVSMVFIIILTSCQYKKHSDFFENERVTLINITKEIIGKLGLENFEVLAYSHKGINNRIVSRSILDRRYSGTKFKPELAFGNGYFSQDDLNSDIADTNTWVQERSIVANYEPNSKIEITFDYITILIIFDEINETKKTELLKIINSYVLNVERGDNIYIISKEEFNKL